MLHVRVSSDKQADKGYSLAEQLTGCREKAQAEGWEIVGDCYVDTRTALEIVKDGDAWRFLDPERARQRGGNGHIDPVLAYVDDMTGESLDRPGYGRMLDYLRQGQQRANGVLVFDLDRLARGYLCILAEEEINRLGAKVFSVLAEYQDSDEGRLLKQMRAVISGYEKAKIKERCMRGKLGKMRQGYVLSGRQAPYGYRYQADETCRGQLIIVDAEAEIVRRAFAWYIEDDLSLWQVGKKLIAQGVSTPGGGSTWDGRTVGHILGHTIYTGVLYAHRETRVNGRETQRPREEWIPIQVPAIVDQATFDAAQARLAHNRECRRKPPKFDYLLSGAIKCGIDGHNYVGQAMRLNRQEPYRPKRYYSCGYGRKHKIHIVKYLPAEPLEDAVWGVIRQAILDPAKLQEGYAQSQKELQQAEGPTLERLETIGKLRAKAQQKLKGLLDAYLDPDMALDKSQYLQKRGELEKEIATWEREEASVKQRLSRVAIDAEQKRAVEQFCQECAAGIDSLDFADKRKLLRMLRVEVTITLGENDYTAEVSGQFPTVNAIVPYYNKYDPISDSVPFCVYLTIPYRQTC